MSEGLSLTIPILAHARNCHHTVILITHHCCCCSDTSWSMLLVCSWHERLVQSAVHYLWLSRTNHRSVCMRYKRPFAGHNGQSSKILVIQMELWLLLRNTSSRGTHQTKLWCKSVVYKRQLNLSHRYTGSLLNLMGLAMGKEGRT